LGDHPQYWPVSVELGEHEPVVVLKSRPFRIPAFDLLERECRVRELSERRADERERVVELRVLRRPCERRKQRRFGVRLLTDSFVERREVERSRREPASSASARRYPAIARSVAPMPGNAGEDHELRAMKTRSERLGEHRGRQRCSPHAPHQEHGPRRRDRRGRRTREGDRKPLRSTNRDPWNLLNEAGLLIRDGNNSGSPGSSITSAGTARIGDACVYSTAGTMTDWAGFGTF
jgi:hypothetical protein